MVELYVKVRQPEVLLRNTYSIKKNRVDALREAAKGNLTTLKVLINTELEGSVISEHYLAPALTVVVDEKKHSLNKVLTLLREQPYVEVAELITQPETIIYDQ